MKKLLLIASVLLATSAFADNNNFFIDLPPKFLKNIYD